MTDVIWDDGAASRSGDRIVDDQSRGGVVRKVVGIILIAIFTAILGPLTFDMVFSPMRRHPSA